MLNHNLESTHQWLGKNEQKLDQKHTIELQKQQVALDRKCACVHGAQCAHAQQIMSIAELGKCSNKEDTRLYSYIIIEDLSSPEHATTIATNEGPCAGKIATKEKAYNCTKTLIVRGQAIVVFSGPRHVAEAERSS